jgi:hypothetical protein
VSWRGNRVPFGRKKDIKRSGGKKRGDAAMTDLLGERNIIPAGARWFA